MSTLTTPIPPLRRWDDLATEDRNRCESVQRLFYARLWNPVHRTVRAYLCRIISPDGTALAEPDFSATTEKDVCKRVDPSKVEAVCTDDWKILERAAQEIEPDCLSSGVVPFTEELVRHPDTNEVFAFRLPKGSTLRIPQESPETSRFLSGEELLRLASENRLYWTVFELLKNGRRVT